MDKPEFTDEELDQSLGLLNSVAWNDAKIARWQMARRKKQGAFYQKFRIFNAKLNESGNAEAVALFRLGYAAFRREVEALHLSLGQQSGVITAAFEMALGLLVATGTDPKEIEKARLKAAQEHMIAKTKERSRQIQDIISGLLTPALRRQKDNNIAKKIRDQVNAEITKRALGNELKQDAIRRRITAIKKPNPDKPG